MTANFLVDESMKGNARGKVQLVTGFGYGDCGLAGSLLGSIAGRIPLALEITPVASRTEQYVVDFCSYFEPISSLEGRPEQR